MVVSQVNIEGGGGGKTYIHTIHSRKTMWTFEMTPYWNQVNTGEPAEIQTDLTSVPSISP